MKPTSLPRHRPAGPTAPDLDLPAGSPLYQARLQLELASQETFADFKEQTWDNTGRWVTAIPVDHLGYRKTSLGTQSGLNLQDATLLKIQITYYHPLIIPFVDHLFAAAGGTGRQIGNTLGHPVLPLTAETTQRMQAGRRIPLDPPPHRAVEGLNPKHYHDIDTLLEALRLHASRLGCSL